MYDLLLKNESVRVEFEEDQKNGKGCIHWYDVKDNYNDFKGFTQNTRGIKKAVEFIKQLAKDERLKDDVTMGNITDLMDKFKLKPHTYCGMD